ncbi:hypothetical protein CN151_11445 [Sinorhizobium meliloti]|nr:hypothetical protein CN151_11445 [Sinorhizobium meliloti]RVM94305.1 hypothetical protein CN119_12000 [Sinorhizobium meliloti]RVN06771.1 hypothetical protein CN112_20215 [Sinorhizobium meliloti]
MAARRIRFASGYEWQGHLGRAQTRLLFIVEVRKDLLADEGFLNLLRAEGLETTPRALATRISGGCDE